MVKENHENDHDLFYSYFWMTTESSDHVLVSSGPNVVAEIIVAVYSFHYLVPRIFF